MPTRSSRLPVPFLLFLGDASATAAEMKIRASAFIKQVVSAVLALAKSKSTALRNKTSAMKARFLVFALLRNKKTLMTAVAHKVHALTHGKDAGAGGRSPSEANVERNSKAIVLYNSATSSPAPHAAWSTTAAEPISLEYGYDDSSDDEDEYPDLRHCLFDLEEEDEEEMPGESVIEMVKCSKEDGGEKFNLEEEIDHVADMFIQKFHKHIRIEQKKRYKEMLQRGN